MKLIEALRISGNQRSFLGRGLVGMLCLALFASCSRDFVGDNVNTNQDVTVSFTMSLGSPEQVTRAGNINWQDYDSIPGEGVENHIDVSKLHVYFYDTNGKYVSKVENLVVDSIGTTTYRVQGVMRVDTVQSLSNYRFSGKVVVYANTDDSSIQRDSLRADDVSNLTYSYDPSTTLTSIPMWGVKAISNVDFTPGHNTDLSEIWLLRAMAKVNVNLTQDMIDRGYTLTNVSLKGYNTSGYVVPLGYSLVDNTRVLFYNGGNEPQTFHSVSTGSDVETNLVFTNKTLYLPEYDNANSTTPDSITVTITNTANGTERTATFPFAQYTNGDRTGNMNIVRNHAYTFNVYGNPIKIDLKVVPWTVFSHDPITM